MTSFLMYVSAAAILVGPKTRRPNQTETFVEICLYVYHIVRIPVVAVKVHNVYGYAIERHPWQVSENHGGKLGSQIGT